MNVRRINDVKAIIAYLKERIGIVEVLNEKVEMEKAGSDLYKAICCFHDEKTPSLTATPSKGLYYCFGCKATGDIVSFYRNTYNMTTIEAVYALAEKYQVDIRQFERDLTEEEKLHAEYRKTLNAIIDKAMELALDPTTTGGSYLAKRGIPESVIRDMRIGYVPNLKALGVNIPTHHIHALELDKPSMLEDAMLYPHFDSYGQVVGLKTRPFWGGKLVDERGRKLPKFLGVSSNFPLFDENHVYGLHTARKAIEKGRMILVEGQHDLLSMHAFGFANTVASDGTALTEAKLNALKEIGVRELIVMYDGDSAGITASIGIAENVLNRTDMSVRIASLSDGKDPDEILQNGDMVQIEMALAKAVYGGQFLLERTIATSDLNSVTGKMTCVHQAIPIFNKVNGLERTLLIEFLGEKLGVYPNVIEDLLRHENSKSEQSLLYNIEGESLVLAEMIRNQDFRLEAMTELREDSFYLSKHSVLYRMITQLEESGTTVQLDTLMIAMNNGAYKQLLNDGEYIKQVMNSIGNVQMALADVVDKATRRKVVTIFDKYNKEINDLSSKTPITLDAMITEVEGASGTTVDNMLDASTGAKDFMDRLHERMQNPNAIPGIELGDRFPRLTDLLGGVQGKKLITVSANQSVGKTTVLANWLDEIAVTQKLPWVHFSLEMTAPEMVDKIIGIRAGVNNRKISRGNLTQEEYSAVQRASLEYYEGGLIILDDQRTLEGITNTIRKLKRTKKIAGVSIDYVQLMSIERNKAKQRYEELGDISGILKTDIANKLDLPVIILSQLNRSALQKNIATAEDGAGSYKIAQDSDVYITLKEKTIEEIEEQGGIERGNLVLNLDKNRSGQADVLLDIYFQKDKQQMSEVRI